MKKIGRSSKVFIATLVLIILGFIGLFIYCSVSSDIMHTYVFEKGNMNIP